MNTFKKIVVFVLCMSLVAAFSIAGTIAYLTSQDEDVNVMTLGNVKIEQIEQERDENGNLQDFTQNKPAFPAVGPIEWDDTGVVVNGTEYKVFTDDLKNVVDKIVTVKNTGKSDAFVRTIIAIEAPGYDPNDLIHVNVNSAPVLTHTSWAPVVIDGVEYVYAVFTYNEALEPGEISAPSMMQVFLDSKATNEDVDKFGDTWEILVATQAIQTQGFTDPATALNEGFGVISATNHPWINDDLWTGEADTAWYDDAAATYELSTPEQLAGLAELVNGGNTFKGKTVVLTDDINLANVEWNPIGNSSNAFQGTFDGQGHTISDLFVSSGKSNVGLFGYTTNGEIKNLNVHNAQIQGRLNVGVVAGTPYTSKYTNISVTGHVRVEGMSYVGGVGGKNAYADWTNVTIDVDEHSYVKANSIENGEVYRTYVGGVVGFMGEGGHSMTNVNSNIDVIGTTCDVGGIVGIAHYGNNFINCFSSGDVTITDAEEAGDAEQIGGIAGVWNNTGADVTFENCSYTGTLTANITDGVDLSDNTITGAAYSVSGSGNLIIK